MSDYNDRLDDPDDRPRRRDDRDDRPKPKSKLPLILIILGVLGLVCMGVCGGVGYWFYSVGKGGQTAAEGVLTKVGNGDLAGGYAAMSAKYKAGHTQEQFETAMKDGKLTDFASVSWTQANANGQTMVISGPAKLKSGGTATVSATVTVQQDLKTWEVDDLSGTAGK
jgi:hypothetical protein